MGQPFKRVKWTTRTGDLLFSYALMAPALIVLALVVFYPMIKGIFVSFCDYTFKCLNNPQWNSFGNYKKIFESNAFLHYLGNTVLYVGGTVTSQFILAMVLALLLNTDIKGRRMFRSLFLMSWTIPTIVVSILWSWLLQPQYGLFNYVLHSLNLIKDPNMQWLSNPDFAMGGVILAMVWKQAPYMIIMILAGLQAVNTDLLDAAAIDGASYLRTFIHVVLPSIAVVLGTTVIISVLDAFQQFTIIFNMTAGGPLKKTTTLSIAAYKEAFTHYDLGAGSAIGVIWMIILSTITIIFNVKSKRLEE